MTMQVSRSRLFALVATLGLLFGSATISMAANPVSNADELVAQHLNSIAPAAVRAGFKTRVVQGPAEFRVMVGGAGTTEGKSFLVSDGNKLVFVVKLPTNTYRGEQFTFDGQKDSVAFSTPKQTRSAFGSFVFVQDAVIREGLLGGTMTTAWPLLNLNERKAKLKFEGLKKVDGQQLYELRYHPRKSSDLEISLYFDPETYRHVETVYSYSSPTGLADADPNFNGADPNMAAAPGGMGAALQQEGAPTSETNTARQFLNRYRLQEKFSDFKTIDGVTVPTQDDIQFTQELQNGRTTLWDWQLKSLDVSLNAGVDPKNFQVK